jgi:hypothetical protein
MRLHMIIIDILYYQLLDGISLKLWISRSIREDSLYAIPSFQ